MKRKMAFSLMAAFGVFAAIGGCGNSATQGENVEIDAPQSTETAQTTEELESGDVELTIWSEGVNFDVMNKMIEGFKQEHAGEANFTINLVESSDAEARNNVLADVHNAADIFPLADDQLTAMVGAGALAEVPDAARIKEVNLEDAIEASSVDGTLYAYPMTADNGYFLYYDKRYLSDADVQTLDGILNVAAANQKKFSMDWTSSWYMYAFFGGTGLEFGVNDDGVTNYCNWNTTEGNIKGVDIAQSLLAIATHPGFASKLDTEFMQGVQDGSIIAGVSGVWNAVEVEKAWGTNYGATKLPTYTCAGQQIQMSSFKGYKMLGVNYYSKHKGWALKLAEYLTNEANQTLRLQERKQGPSNKNAAASEAVQQVPAIKAVLAQAEYGKLQRVGNNYWDPFSEFGQTMAAGNPNNIDLQELMDILVTGITQSTVQ